MSLQDCHSEATALFQKLWNICLAGEVHANLQLYVISRWSRANVLMWDVISTSCLSRKLICCNNENIEEKSLLHLYVILFVVLSLKPHNVQLVYRSVRQSMIFHEYD